MTVSGTLNYAGTKLYLRDTNCKDLVLSISNPDLTLLNVTNSSV